MKVSDHEAASVGREVISATVAAGTLGLFSALGDWIWLRYIPDGAILPGLVHGVLVFILLAFALGRSATVPGATRRLLLSLPIAGLAIAGAFYPLAYVFGYLGSLLVTWIGMWSTLALLQRRALGKRETLSSALARGLLAGAGSGFAFWAVSGMWTDPSFAGGVPVRFLYWTFAFVPGFLALLLRRDREPRA